MGGGGERADVDEVQGKKGRRCLAFLAALPVHGDYESTRVHESNGGGNQELENRTESSFGVHHYKDAAPGVEGGG